MARFPPPSVSIPTTGSLEQRVRVMAEVLGRKADQTAEPIFTAVMLQAPGGAVYRVSVDDTGLLQTVVVPR